MGLDPNAQNPSQSKVPLKTIDQLLIHNSDTAVKPIIGETYGKELTTKWYVYWRLFFLSCSELFNYSDGNEWFVSHYLFEKSS